MTFSKHLFDPSKVNIQYLNSELRPVSIAVWAICSVLIISVTALKPVQAITNLNPHLLTVIALPHFILVLTNAIRAWITGKMYRPVWTAIGMHVNLLVIFPAPIIAGQIPMTPVWAMYLFCVAIVLNALGFQIYYLFLIMLSGMVPWLFFLVVKPEMAHLYLPVCIMFTLLGFVEYLFIGLIVTRSRKMLVLEERLAYEQRQNQEIRRIWNDIHDGIGSHLNLAILSNRTAQNAVDKENPDISQSRLLIRESADNLIQALAEMREAVSFNKDGLACTTADLADHLRRKFTTAFELKKISLTIAIGDYTAAKKLSPATAHVIRRIIQESLTNILRHSNATCADVYFHKINTGMEIVISDNGTAARLDNNHQGSGMEIMHKRAREIGADLKINRTDTGSVMVQLQISQV